VNAPIPTTLVADGEGLEKQQLRHTAYVATGLFLIAVVPLIFTITRCFRYIRWNAR